MSFQLFDKISDPIAEPDPLTNPEVGFKLILILLSLPSLD
jgi:hypothetical protein